MSIPLLQYGLCALYALLSTEFLIVNEIMVPFSGDLSTFASFVFVPFLLCSAYSITKTILYCYETRFTHKRLPLNGFYPAAAAAV